MQLHFTIDEHFQQGFVFVFVDMCVSFEITKFNNWKPEASVFQKSPMKLQHLPITETTTH